MVSSRDSVLVCSFQCSQTPGAPHLPSLIFPCSSSKPVLQHTTGGSSTLVFSFHLALVWWWLGGTVLHSSVTHCPLLQSSFTILKIPYSSMHFVLPFLTTQFLICIQLYKHTCEYIIYYTYYMFFLFQNVV